MKVVKKTLYDKDKVVKIRYLITYVLAKGGERTIEREFIV